MAVTTIARRVLATGAIAGTALLALTIPASAHNHGVEAKCTDNGSYVKVNLTNYNGGKTNTVKVVIDDQTAADEQFKSQWQKNYDLDNTKDHTYTVAVQAGDDPNGHAGYTFTESGKIEACVTPPPVTTTTTVAPPTTPTTTTTTVAPTTTSPAATPPQDQGGLANTGASVGLPLGIGALLLVGGGALLLVVRKRRSAA